MSVPTVLPRNLSPSQLAALYELGLDDVEIAKLQAGQKLGRRIKPLPPIPGEGAKYSPDQDRVPAGVSTGGRFAPMADAYDAMQKGAEAATLRSEARSREDQTAVDMYQSTRWLEINDPLRFEGDPATDAYEGGLGRTETLDGTKPHSPASDIARLDRLMTSEGGAPMDAYLYRGVHSDNVFPAEHMAAGYLFLDNGYASTTTDKDNAMGFAFPGEGKPAKTIVVIKARRGQPSLWMDYEVLLPRGTTLRVTMDGHDRASGARVINAEIVQ